MNPNPSPPPAIEETDAWRPRYHYTPDRNWMNDPNGLVFWRDEYHLYYQYNPRDAQWGHIGWGHAVSADLVSWRELPPAISATDRLMAFSGSVVVDHEDTSGFAPPGAEAPALVAFFTGFDPITKIQSQHVAYSLDGGRSYTAYKGNPVIDIGSTEFRDPKVFWHESTARWVMLVVAALRQEMWLYTSENLRDWSRTSTFGPAGSAANNIWEVPDLFELSIDDDPARKRWVLVISVNHGTLWGGSGVQYFIGDFDGTRFVADASASQGHRLPGPVVVDDATHRRASSAEITLWADHGRDFYAPLTFSNLPAGRVLWMGWMSNWDYARELPTQPWRGQQSLPRELSLASTPRGLRLRQRVAAEARSLVEPQAWVQLGRRPAAEVAEALLIAVPTVRQLMARLVVSTKDLDSPIGLDLFKGEDGSVKVGFDPLGNTFFIDRRTPSPRFKGQSERHHAARLLQSDEVKFEVWIDGSTLEVFGDDGTVVLTDLAYPDPMSTGIGLFHGPENPLVALLELHRVRPILHPPRA